MERNRYEKSLIRSRRRLENLSRWDVQFMVDEVYVDCRAIIKQVVEMPEDEKEAEYQRILDIAYLLNESVMTKGSIIHKEYELKAALLMADEKTIKKFSKGVEGYYGPGY